MLCNAFVKNAQKSFISPILSLPFNALGLFMPLERIIGRRALFFLSVDLERNPTRNGTTGITACTSRTRETRLWAYSRRLFLQVREKRGHSHAWPRSPMLLTYLMLGILLINCSLVVEPLPKTLVDSLILTYRPINSTVIWNLWMILISV